MSLPPLPMMIDHPSELQSRRPTMSSCVYIAYTGGTIGMRKTPHGYAPEAGYLEERLKEISLLRGGNLPEYTIHEYSPLLDSSNMTPDDWFKIARDVARNYDDYDGFIVLHGTDTMAYTASALSFLLDGLAKPVVLTGSQIPWSELRSDARDNLIGSLLIAGNYPVREVCLYFDNQLLRGNRSVKIDANGLHAFASPNFPVLGEAGVELEINWDFVLQPEQGQPLTVEEFKRTTVGALRLFPGISAEMVHNVLRPPLAGLVLEAYGVGNAPEHPDFLEALQKATRRGVTIVDCTQCLQGSVRLEDYATGSGLARAGVLSGYDMTAEAALTKLLYLLNGKKSPAEVRRLVETNLRGELTR